MQFLYELKHMLDFPFSIPFHFYETFCSTKNMDSLTLKGHDFFRNKIVEKPHTLLLPDF